jgi:hypothetical protein
MNGSAKIKHKWSTQTLFQQLGKPIFFKKKLGEPTTDCEEIGFVISRLVVS